MHRRLDQYVSIAHASSSSLVTGLLAHSSTHAIGSRLTDAVPSPMCTPTFAIALFKLLLAISSVNSGAAALLSADVISALLPFLSHNKPEHIEVVIGAIKVIRQFMDRQEAAEVINARGGLELLLRRIVAETSAITAISASSTATAAPKGKLEAATSADSDMSTSASSSSVAAVEQSMEIEGGEVAPNKACSRHVSLLKILLRLFTLLLHSPRSGGGLAALLLHEKLHVCLETILDNWRTSFGSSLCCIGM